MFVTKTVHFLAFLILALLMLGGKPVLAARSAELVADAETGRIIFGEDIYDERHPASLTKMMTLYITFAALEQGRLSLNTRLPVSWKASVQPPSKLGLQEGESIRVREAILALVTQSANDVAVVLGEAIGGSEGRFAQIMTKQARALGMNRTVYQNASGLHDDDQVTTAFDQAILARALLYHFPRYYRYFSTRSFSYEGVTHRNHNRLMSRYAGMDGIKTGFIRPSGFNLVASARRSGTRLVGVVFGGSTARSRDNRMAQLLDAGFERVFAERRTGKVYAGAVSPVDSEAQGDTEVATDNIPLETAAAPVRTKKIASAKPVKKQLAEKKAGWGVQVGSYGSRKLGLSAIAKARKQAGKILGGANAQIVEARSGKKTLFRARLLGLNEKQARSACARLSGGGQSCVTLPPRG